MDEGASRQPIALHAAPTVHPVALGGDDLGELRVRIEARLATWFDDPPALLATGSCSDALAAAAVMVSIEPGDEVIVPAYAFPTAVAPFLSRGASVRFADVTMPWGNVDPDAILGLVGPRTRAVVVMHYAGVDAAGTDLVAALARRGVDLVEDAAHAVFARHDGQALGRKGRFACVSFHRTKNLSALDGGALLVNRIADVDAATIAVDKGTDRAAFFAGRTASYEWRGLGGAWRMPEGALRYLAEELELAAERQQRRQVVWRAYQEQLGPWAGAVGAVLPVPPPGAEPPAHLQHLLLAAGEHRDSFVRHCANQGVEVARHYGSLPATPFGASLARPGDACPVADRFASTVVRIPLHHDLDQNSVERVVAAVTSWRPGV